jgi:hypothetical protein
MVALSLPLPAQRWQSMVAIYLLSFECKNKLNFFLKSTYSNMSSENITPVPSAKNSSVSSRSDETGTIQSVPSVPLQSNGTSDGTLVKLISTYADKPEIVGLAAKVLANLKDYESHQKLRNYLCANQFANECITAYIDEYHEFMYEMINGKKVWKKFGTFDYHCEKKGPDGLTLPAVIENDGTKKWFRNGLNHRDDKDENGHTLPAVIYSNKNKIWYSNGKIHRTDKDENDHTLPAIIDDTFGTRKWFQNGLLHREDKDENGHILPAEITNEGRTLRWYKDGKQHRDDKDEKGLTLPAVIYSDIHKVWYLNGKLHRTDKDENGMTLPAEINGSTLFWNFLGTKHRAEICDDPTSKHYRRALPAHTERNHEVWYYMDKFMTQNDLTAKLLAEMAEGLIEKYGIIESNGVLKITKLSGATISTSNGNIANFKSDVQIVEITQ